MMKDHQPQVPFISVCLPTNNAERSLGTIGSILRNSIKSSEIVVTVQGNFSKAKEIFKSEGVLEDLKLVSDEGRGAARARNIALREATGGNVLITTDDDCIVAPNWVEAWRDNFIKTPGLALGLGAVDRDPQLVKEYGDRGWLVEYHVEPGRVRLDPYRGMDLPPFGFGSNMAIARETIGINGFFDETLGAGVDLVNRRSLGVVERLQAKLLGPIVSGGGDDWDYTIRALRKTLPVQNFREPAVIHQGIKLDEQVNEQVVAYLSGGGALFYKDSALHSDDLFDVRVKDTIRNLMMDGWRQVRSAKKPAAWKALSRVLRARDYYRNYFDLNREYGIFVPKREILPINHS